LITLAPKEQQGLVQGLVVVELDGACHGHDYGTTIPKWQFDGRFTKKGQKRVKSAPLLAFFDESNQKNERCQRCSKQAQ
jgi:hypothetical protein